MLSSGGISALTLAAALGCGLMAGVFFAFSAFVMRALARLPAPKGIAAMQSVNVAVLSSWFLLVFLGTGAVCLWLAIRAATHLREPAAAPMLAGAALYLVGNIVVTFAFNVPRNDRLEAVDPENAEGASVWARYLEEWTRWNHVRTATALLAAAAFTLALVRLV
jgi:uncharacterized membrane protein